MRPSRQCSSCGAPIRWVLHIHTGKPHPLDREPNPEGNLVAWEANPAFVVVAGKQRRPGEVRYMSHFATCPNAEQHRSKKSDPTHQLKLF